VPLRVAVVIFAPGNRYQELLHAALAEHAVSTLAGRPTPWWMWRRRADFDVIHLHWIEFLLDRRGGKPLAVAALLSVVASLRLARLLGKRVVWTVHNPQPHDRSYPRLQRVLFRVVARLSDVLVAHTDTSAALVRGRLGAGGRTVVIPHGNFIGAYPPDGAGRAATRARYGLGDDELVLLAFGQVRPYKRLLDTARAVRGLDDERVRLVVVGRPTDPAEAQRLRAAAAGDPRIVVDLRHVPDAEVSALHAMADAAITPYVRGFASGALVLALSCGLPVLAPAAGTAAELALPEALIEFTGGDLGAAVAELRRRPAEDMRAAALASAERVPWSASARELVRAYRG
jgi:glycosyltransferase involved in cell wall biosynthesis